MEDEIGAWASYLLHVTLEETDLGARHSLLQIITNHLVSQMALDQVSLSLLRAMMGRIEKISAGWMGGSDVIYTMRFAAGSWVCDL